MQQSKQASEIEFGRIFAAILFTLFAYQRLIKGVTRWPLLVTAVALGLLAQFYPSVLRWPNLIWYRIGLILHRVMQPVIMTVLFFFVFTPFGIILRAFRVHLLDLDPNPKTESYWHAVSPPIQIQTENVVRDEFLSMKDQF